MDSTILDLINKARRRAVGMLLVDELTVGAIAALGGAIALLLLGTQILDWWWPLLLFAAGAGISAWRSVSAWPTPYQVAQIIDQRLGLHDAVSTAFHFLQLAPAGHPSPAIVAAQKEAAAQAAATVDAAHAMPWRVPRRMLAAALMAVAALSLFLLRYGLTGSLDLKSPIVEAVSDFFQPANSVVAGNKRAPKLPGQDPLGIATDRPDGPKPDVDNGAENALDVVDTPNVDVPIDPKDQARVQPTEAKAAGEDAQKEGEGSEDGERGKGGEDSKEGGADSNKDSGESGKQGGQQNSKEGGNDNSSLMDKMRDAMANLMAKMKIPQQQGGSQSKQTSNNQKGGQKGSQQQEAGGGQKGEKGQGNPQGKGSPSDDADAEGQQSQDQQAQAGQGKSNDKGQDGGSPNEAKSGMGKQDGSKDLKDAEQVAALGKLSEIFGKRAQNITGDVMVEVTNSKQQTLRTGYTQRNAAHSDKGGEIHRDQVPEAFQHYVQQYFQQVRKGEVTPAPDAPQPAAAAAPAPAQKK